MTRGVLDRPSNVLPGLAFLLAVLAFGTTAWLWHGGGGAVDLPWAPTLGLRLHFRLDGLGALYSLLATGVGAAVFLFSARYLPLHLQSQRRPAREQIRFYGLLVLFMLSMVGLATAQDLILLFVFWDLTAVSSYFLIAYDRHEAASRWAALMALLVTGVTAVLLLIAALLLHAQYGTFALPELFERAEAGATLTAAGTLVALAAVAKSAQVPFHFWLPRAMTAPTPVSAYLHSAAMVAAGVLLIGRTYPLLEPSGVILDGLLIIGFGSILVGGVLALTRDNLKQILAYSTFSQYGYVVFMYGLGGTAAAVGACFYVIVHALAKCALFLTAGAVAEATGGAQRLGDVGGLARAMPVVAAGSAAAAATVTALPLTVGFFADELFFTAALERGPAFAIMALAAAALTFAYLARFWGGIFLGRRSGETRPLGWPLVAPISVLGLLVVAGGLVPGPFERLAEAAGESSVGGTAAVSVAYHLDARTVNLMALGAYALGAVILLGNTASIPIPRAVAKLGSRIGPERWYGSGLALLNRLSDRIHDLEVRDVRTRVAAVLVPAGVLVVLGLLATPTQTAYAAGSLAFGDVGVVGVLVFAALGGLAATVPRTHLTIVLSLSVVGFALAAVYAFLGGPDVALIAVLAETIFALLFLGVFSLLPSEVLRREATLPTRGTRRWRDPLVGLISGGIAFIVVWGALSRPSVSETVATEQTRLTPEAHGKDVVTTILADFRALDTLGEVTVVVIALAGVVSLLRRGRLW